MPLSLSVAILLQTNCSLQDAATGKPGVSRWCCTAHRSHSAFDPLVTTTSRHMSIVRVAFQYDYQCDQIGMFAFLVKVTDFTTAAKCVMAMGNPDLTLEIRREALTLAAQNPQLVASWTHDEDGAFHHLSDEWCQDLILATLQAVEAKNTVWLAHLWPRGCDDCNSQLACPRVQACLFPAAAEASQWRCVSVHQLGRRTIHLDPGLACP